MALHLRPLPNGLVHIPPVTEKLLAYLLPRIGQFVSVEELRNHMKPRRLHHTLNESRPRLNRLGLRLVTDGYRHGYRLEVYNG